MGATDPYIPTILAIAAGAYLLWAIFRKLTGRSLRAGEEAILALAICWIIAALPLAALMMFDSVIDIPGELENLAFGAAAIWGIAWVLGGILMAVKAMEIGEH